MNDDHNICNIAVQASRSITDKIANTGSGREATLIHYYWDREAQPLPSTQTALWWKHAPKKEGFQNKNSSCHSWIMETKSPCIPLWTGDMQWVGRGAEGGFDLSGVNRGDRPRAQNPWDRTPQSHTCSTRRAASATFPFLLPSFHPSLFLLHLHPLPPASFHRLTPDPAKTSRIYIVLCLRLRFTVRV